MGIVRIAPGVFTCLRALRLRHVDVGLVDAGPRLHIVSSCHCCPCTPVDSHNSHPPLTSKMRIPRVTPTEPLTTTALPPLQPSSGPGAVMISTWNMIKLLTWKNFVLQKRRPVILHALSPPCSPLPPSASTACSTKIDLIPYLVSQRSLPLHAPLVLHCWYRSIHVVHPRVVPVYRLLLSLGRLLSLTSAWQ